MDTLDLGYKLQKEYPDAAFHQGIAVEQLQTYDCFEDGFYLLNIEDTFIRCEKRTIVNAGYVYNATDVAVNILAKWTAIGDCGLPDKLAIQEFQLGSIAEYHHTLIIAERNKPYRKLVAELLDAHPERIVSTLIVSPVDSYDKYYSSKYSGAKILDSLDTDEIEKYMKDIGTSPGYIVFDDALWNSDIHHPVIKNILFNSRNEHKTLITCIQEPSRFIPEIRTNMDYVFMYADDIVLNKKKLYDRYAGMFPTYTTFDGIFKELTKDGCMVINNRKICVNICDKVFYR